MARTAVTVTTLTGNAAVADVTDTTIDATNSHKITPPAGAMVEDLVLRITNTTASTKVATVKAGANPPASDAPADLAVSLTAGNVTAQVKFVRLESGRYVQNNGDVNVDIAAGMTGTIGAFYCPRSI